MAARPQKTAPRPPADSSQQARPREKLGLIAGHGRFPISLAQAAREFGYEVVAVAIESEASQDLAQHVDSIHWVGLGSLSRAIETFRSAGVSELVLAGKIQKGRIFQLEGVEHRLVRALESVKHRADDAVLRVIVRELEASGLKVRESASFLGPIMPQQGTLTRREPDARERADIEFGLKTARQVADLGIGQTVVVKHGVIVAVEAMEGTDQTIARAGACGGPGAVVVKVSGPNQDTRFDMPVVGLRTLEVLAAAKASVLAIEAGRTVVLDRTDFVRQADEMDLAFVAV